jgi:glycosyltransferase involved in cell wall biosynthesis/protein-L-isoaspartate O-methyltransferase
MRLSIIAPCLDEELNIDALADRILAVLDRFPEPAELVLIDDGSTDGTWNRLQGRAGADRRVVTVQHPSNRGIEASWRSGLEHARGEVVCLIDSDLQNRPEDIPRLYAAHMSAGPTSLAQGVRNPAVGVRRLLAFSRALNVLLNLAFGTRLRDGKSGFILCRREVLAHVLQHRFRYRYFQSFIGAAASARGYRIVEIDTVFEPRQAGTSFLSAFPILVSLRILGEMAKMRVDLLEAPHDRLAEAADAHASRRPAGSEDVEQWNDRFSREHDIDEYYTSSSLPIRWIEGRRLRCIRAMASAGAQDRILEVGCGGGHVLRLFPDSDLTGVDVSGVMLEKARRNLEGYRVRLLKGDLADLGLPDASFDRIICTEVLEHAADPAGILAQIQRLVRPGGRVVVTFPNDRLIHRIKRVLHGSGLTMTPMFRRVSWGADHYHLHVWSIPEMRALLNQHLAVAEERFVPSRFLPIRCCFRCEPRPAERSGPGRA